MLRRFRSLSYFSGKNSRNQKAENRFRPVIEILEDRCTPATFTVTNNLDAGTGSLREAVGLANSTSGADTITFDGSLNGQTITLTTGELTLTDTTGATTITGLGANNLSVSGNNASRVFRVASGVTAGFSGLKIENGNQVGGGDNGGAGLFSLGTVTLTDCTFINNHADTNGFGGAIVNNGPSMTIQQCLITQNTASFLAMVNGANATLVITNSTISDNSSTNAAANGGAINNVAGATLIINGNTVFSGNTASAGGAIENDGTLNVSNTTFTSQTVAGKGAAIYNKSTGSATITTSSFTNNNGGLGGAVANEGNLTINQSSFSSNTSTSDGGAMWNAGTATVSGTEFVGNTSGQVGGAIHVETTGTLTLINSTVRNNTSANDGGGMENYGNTTIFRSTIKDNTAGSGTFGSGGAIHNLTGQVVVRDSTLSGNTAKNVGGAIDNRAVVKMINSTLSGNSAREAGGAFSQFEGSTTFTNTTITGNRSDSDNSGGELGGGILRAGTSTAELFNTIVAGNFRGTGTTSNDVSGSLVATSANNLIGDAGSAGGLTNGINGNLVGNGGSGVRPIATILNTTLANNGGPTLTHALVAGSPAINAGSNAKAVNQNNVTLTNDQRGVPFVRISNTTVDIGAFEAQGAPSQALLVDIAADEDDGNYSVGDLSLREAVRIANETSGANTIGFAAGLNGQTITLSLGGLFLTDTTGATTINGPGETNLRVSGANAYRIFTIMQNVTATITGLTFRNGFIGGTTLTGTGGAVYNLGTLTIGNSTISLSNAVSGGAVYSRNGTLTINESKILSNSSSRDGGGVYVEGGTFTSSKTTFSGNTGENGGGLMINSSTVNITDATFRQNATAVGQGGAIFNILGSSLTVANSSFTENTATTQGGAIANAGSLTVSQTSFSSNTSTSHGGALWNDGTMNLTGVDIVGNTAGDQAGGIYTLVNSTTSITNSTLRNNTGSFNGGGLVNHGNVTILRSTFKDNIAGNAGPGSGGAFVHWSGQMIVRDSTLSGNSSSAFGGAIDNRDVLDIINSTISGNSAPQSGGALSQFAGDTIFTNTTITRNRSDSDNSGGELGGGVFAPGGSVELFNTIVAGNFTGTGTTSNDVSGNLVSTSANNLIGDAGSAGGLTNGSNGNLVGNGGSGVRPIATILNTTLANNGGPTLTHALVAGSPAINAGSNADATDENVVPLANDQRGSGFARIFNTTVDIGAFEFSVVDTTNPTTTISAPSATATKSGPVTFTVTYADANLTNVTLTANDITLNKTGTANGTVIVGGTGASRTVTIQNITGNGTLGISVAAGKAIDVVGNLAPGAGPSATFIVDNTPPTVTLSGPSTTVTKSGPVSYTVTYADARFDVSTLTAANVNLLKTGTANGTVAVSGTGATRVVTINGITGNGTLGISLVPGTARDKVGNLAPASAGSTLFTVDNTGPTVSFSNPSRSFTVAGPITYTVTFADPRFSSSAAFTAAKIYLLKTGSANATITVAPGTGATRVVTLSSIVGGGTLGIGILGGSAVDTLGNLSLQTNSTTTFRVNRFAVLDVSLGLSPATVTTAGLTYVINFKNTGNLAATNVSLVQMPPSLTSAFVSASSTAGWVRQANGTYTFNLGTVAAGASGSVRFTVRFSSPPGGAAIITNFVQILAGASIMDESSSSTLLLG